MGRLVDGFGINDAGYVTQKYGIFEGKYKRIWACPFYLSWRHMIGRCYSKKYHSKFPTYVDCRVSEEWRKFSAFRGWMELQDWQGKQLDKDILVRGNKVYSPETCVFVDPAVNWFFLDCAASRGDLPVGVSFHRCSGRYQAQCRNPFTGKKEYLGSFSDPGEAHLAWKGYKHKLACQYADMQKDERVAIALRDRYA